MTDEKRTFEPPSPQRCRRVRAGTVDGGPARALD
jgi:hypothetical protein